MTSPKILYHGKRPKLWSFGAGTAINLQHHGAQRCLIYLSSLTGNFWWTPCSPSQTAKGSWANTFKISSDVSKLYLGSWRKSADTNWCLRLRQRHSPAFLDFCPEKRFSTRVAVRLWIDLATALAYNGEACSELPSGLGIISEGFYKMQ